MCLAWSGTGDGTEGELASRKGELGSDGEGLSDFTGPWLGEEEAMDIRKTEEEVQLDLSARISALARLSQQLCNPDGDH